MTSLNIVKIETGIWTAWIGEENVGSIVTMDGGDGSIACKRTRTYAAKFHGFNHTGTLASCKKWLKDWAQIWCGQ